MEVDDEGLDWAGLPSVVLQPVYKHLSPKDRLNASSTCTNWRRSVFQNPLDDNINLTVENFEKDCDKYQFLSSCFAHKVAHVSLTFDAGSPECLGLICDTLELLEGSTALKSLRIRYTEKCIWNPLFNGTNALAQILLNHFIEKIIEPLLRILGNKHCLETIDFPLVQQLVHQRNRILEKMAYSRMNCKLRELFLTTVRNSDLFKGVPYNENTVMFDSIPDHSVQSGDCVFYKFRNLQKLSIDHDILTDVILSKLGMGTPKGLELLNLTAVKENVNTSNDGWKHFVANNSICKVRLTVMGAKLTLDNNSNLCFPSTPLTYFRALYCRRIRMNTLNSIILWNENRLEHLELVNENQDWTDNIIQSANHLGHDFIDPIIFAAWRVKTLRTVKIGYLYCGHDLIGVAKLAKSLQRLEIPNSQILDGNIPTLCMEVSRAIGREWTPIDDGFLPKSRSQVMQRRVSRSYQAVLEENY